MNFFLSVKYRTGKLSPSLEVLETSVFVFGLVFLFSNSFLSSFLPRSENIISYRAYFFRLGLVSGWKLFYLETFMEKLWFIS